MNEENEASEAVAVKPPAQQSTENEASADESGTKSDFDTFFENNADKIRQVLAALMGARDTENDSAADSSTGETEPQQEAPPGESEEKTQQLTAKEEQLAKMERELNYRKLQYDTVKLLESLNMPTNVSEFVIGTDMKDTERKIGKFKIEFDKAVQASVNDRLRGKPPKTGRMPEADSTETARENIREIMTGGTK